VNGVRDQLWRFALVGGSNTLITMAAMALLAQFMDPALAFTLVFVGGVVYACMMTSRYVFKSRPSRVRLAAFGLWYVLVYVIGLVVVRLLERNHLGGLAIAMITVCVTAPLSFLGGRALFHNSRRGVGASSIQGHA
jgi:putative flippase GtrA